MSSVLPSVAQFPLGKTGGLIEAPLHSPCCGVGWEWFPLGKTGGLIEAPRLAALVVAGLTEFPLGKTGGLIEASRCATDAVPNASFRWVKPAASLKPPAPPPAAARRCVFPLGKTGGLIEATARRAAHRESQPWFPLGKTGGLIEARCRTLTTTSKCRCFRWVKPAASLKQLRRFRGGLYGSFVSAG